MPKCNGEIIEYSPGGVTTWIVIDETKGVKTHIKVGLPASLFANLPTDVGSEFVWDSETGEVVARQFDNADIVAECKRLDAEWENELKHLEPRMALDTPDAKG